MGSSLNDASVFKDHDRIAVADSGQSVGDNKYGTPFHQVIHTLLYNLLCPGIDGGCRLIQDQHRRISDGSPGNRKELSLSLGKFFPIAA